MSEWLDFPKNKPNQNQEVLILLKNGSILRAKYMLVVFVEQRRDYNYLGNEYRIVGGHDPFEVFIPHKNDFSPDFKELIKETTHYMPMINLPLVFGEKK